MPYMSAQLRAVPLENRGEGKKLHGKNHAGWSSQNDLMEDPSLSLFNEWCYNCRAAFSEIFGIQNFKNLRGCEE